MTPREVSGLLLSIGILLLKLSTIVTQNPSVSIERIRDAKIQANEASIDGEAVKFNHYRAFRSDETYVVTVRDALEDGHKLRNIFYWIGSQSSRGDALKAAVYAVELHFTFHGGTDVLRETEGRESSTFKALFEPYTLHSAKEEISDKMVYKGETRMILMRNSDEAMWEEVDVSSQYARREDICFVAFNLETVFLYCGNGVRDEAAHMKMAVLLTKIISSKLGPHISIIKKVKGHGDPQFFIKFQQVCEVLQQLEASSEYEEMEVLKPENMKLERSFTIFKSSSRTEQLGEEAVDVNMLYLFPFHTEHCYVLDTHIEDVGLLVWMGAQADLNRRKMCTVRGEYHKSDLSFSRGPVTFISEENVRLPRGERKIRVDVQNFVKLMKRLNLSWTDVLKNPDAAV